MANSVSNLAQQWRDAQHVNAVVGGAEAAKQEEDARQALAKAAKKGNQR